MTPVRPRRAPGFRQRIGRFRQAGAGRAARLRRGAGRRLFRGRWRAVLRASFRRRADGLVSLADFRESGLNQSPLEGARLNRNVRVRKGLTGPGLIEAHYAVRAVGVTSKLSEQVINLNCGPLAAIG